jgi:hypothetical protein
MKIGDLVDIAIQDAEKPLVIVTANGVEMVTTGWTYSTNKRGEPVIAIKAGRKLTG